MMLTIGYFAGPSAPDVHPANLMITKGHFATRNEAMAHARSTADRLHAHSFIVNFPDGIAERQVRDGKAWKSEDVTLPPNFVRR
jgi:hypothetical protein